MKEGTVSSGVALRPRPTEVQPCFLGSNIYYLEFFYIFEVSRLHIDFCYHIIIFIYFEVSRLNIDFCYHINKVYFLQI